MLWFNKLIDKVNKSNGASVTYWVGYSYSRSEATEEVLCDGYPPVGSGATKLSEGYSPVGSGATKGVLSRGYMLACLFVRIRSCIKTMSPSLYLPYIKTWRKKWRQLSRVLHSFWWSNFPTGGVAWGPCVYILENH